MRAHTFRLPIFARCVQATSDPAVTRIAAISWASGIDFFFRDVTGVGKKKSPDD